MADLSLDNILGYSDLVLLDTSFVSADFGLGKRLYYLTNFFECGEIKKDISHTVEFYESIRTRAINNPTKLQINEEVAQEFTQFGTHLNNCLEYYRLQLSSIDGKTKRFFQERTNEFKRYSKNVSRVREEALDFHKGRKREVIQKELYGIQNRRRLNQVNHLCNTVNRLITSLNRYDEETIRIENRRENISDTDYKIVESALGSLLEDAVKKTCIITSDRHLGEILCRYYNLQGTHPGYLGKVTIYLVDRESDDIQRLKLREINILESTSDKLIYRNDKCNGHGRKVQAKMFQMQEKLGGSYQQNPVCSLLRLPEESDGRRDYRPRT